MKNVNYFLIVVFFILNFWACGKSQEKSQDSIPVKIKNEHSILFIGNSYTYYNEGVDFHLKAMLNADGYSDSLIYIIQKVAKGSYTLEAHFNDQETLNTIISKEWDVVVIQEQSTRPLNNPALFSEYAGKLDKAIKKISAVTVLYMTWARKDQPEDMDGLADSYFSAGKEIKAEVSPVGRVWEYVQSINPNIQLHILDNKHPTLLGTYLTACVFYNTLLEKNPIENAYIPDGLDADDVIIIRKAVYDYMI